MKLLNKWTSPHIVTSHMSLGVYVDATKQHILKSAGLRPATTPQATHYYKYNLFYSSCNKIQKVYYIKKKLNKKQQ